MVREEWVATIKKVCLSIVDMFQSLETSKMDQQRHEVPEVPEGGKQVVMTAGKDTRSIAVRMIAMVAS